MRSRDKATGRRHRLLHRGAAPQAGPADALNNLGTRSRGKASWTRPSPLPEALRLGRNRRPQQPRQCAQGARQAGRRHRPLHRGAAPQAGLPGAHNNLGNALQEQGKLDDAVACYTEALRLKPDYPEAHNNLGSRSRRKASWTKRSPATPRRCASSRITRRPQQPRQCAPGPRQAGRRHRPLHRGAAPQPDYPDALNNLGNALQAQGELDEAIARYTEALRLKPDYPDALNNLGTALRAQASWTRPSPATPRRCASSRTTRTPSTTWAVRSGQRQAGRRHRPLHRRRSASSRTTRTPSTTSACAPGARQAGRRGRPLH